MQSVERQPGIVSIRLDPKEESILSTEAKEVGHDFSSLTEATLLDELQRKGSDLKAKLGKVTDFLGEMASHTGVKVAVFDLGRDSVEGVGPTPTKYQVRDEQPNILVPDIYRGLLVGLADWYGYGFTTQQDGVIHNDIIPVKEHAATKGHSGNAKYELGLHVEDASFNLGPSLDISPDFLTLQFLRNNNNVPTVLSAPNWTEISHKTRDLLSEEWFFNQTNPLQGGERNNPPKSVAIIYGPSKDPWIRLNTSKLNLEKYQPQQAQALSEFTDHLNENRALVAATAGEVLVFDNRRVLHGRAPYTEGDYPRYDGTDRWQRRLTVSNDDARIQEFEACRRVVDPSKLFTKISKG